MLYSIRDSTLYRSKRIVSCVGVLRVTFVRWTVHRSRAVYFYLSVPGVEHVLNKSNLFVIDGLSIRASRENALYENGTNHLAYCSALLSPVRRQSYTVSFSVAHHHALLVNKRINFKIATFAYHTCFWSARLSLFGINTSSASAVPLLS